MSDATGLTSESKPILEDASPTKEPESNVLGEDSSNASLTNNTASTSTRPVPTNTPSKSSTGLDERRKRSPPPRGRGKPKRGGGPGRPRSPGPPPLPPSFPPPPGYKRPFGRDPSPSYRRGRSPEPPRRRTPPPPPPVPPSVPRPTSFARPRYGSPPRRGSPPSGPSFARRRNSRSRSPPPRPYNRSPPPQPGGRRRSPPPLSRRRTPPPSNYSRRYSRSPPPGRRRSRSPPRGGYRPSSRSPPPYRHRGGSPYSRGGSPTRRRSPIPPRSGNRSPSPSEIRHRLPSPGRDRSRTIFASPTRSGHASRRASPARHSGPSSNARSPPRKRTRSPEKVEAPPTTGDEQDDSRLSKKRRTLDGSSMGQQGEDRPDVYMRGVQVKEEPKSASLNMSSQVERKKMIPPTEPRSFREQANRMETASSVPLRIKTETKDVEMSDSIVGGSGSSPLMTATPSTPAPNRIATAAWRGGSSKPLAHVKQNSSMAAPPDTPNSNQPTTQGPPPPTPIQMTIPMIANWRKDSITPELDAEIERMRQLRLNAIAEHHNIAFSVRRALYELELAEFDLRASEARLAVAEKQSELASKGILTFTDE